MVDFRTQELTGTKFTSIIKAELCIFPVVIISSIVFAQYLWSLAPIPSTLYPYANQMWEQQARQQAAMQSSTLGGAAGRQFYEAIKWKYIAGSTGIGVLLYSVLAWAGAPVMLCYGAWCADWAPALHRGCSPSWPGHCWGAITLNGVSD